MANERFFLIFSEKPNTRVEINEPIDFGQVDFNLDQKEDGHGRDVSLSGGEIKLRFSDQRDHRLDEILYYFHIYGFEADVKLIIQVETGDEFKGEIDFSTAITDDLTYFDFSVILESNLQIFKRRYETKVDMFSSKDINGNYIQPLMPTNMLIQSKPAIQISEWEQSAEFNIAIEASGDGVFNSRKFGQINPAQNLKTSDIKDSYSFFNSSEVESIAEDASPLYIDESYFVCVKAQNNMKNVVVKITDLNINLITDVDNGGNGYSDFKLLVRNGITADTATTNILLSVYKTENQTYDLENGSFEITLPTVQRGESIWVYFTNKVRQSATEIVLTPRFESRVTISGMKMSITAESTAYNSITPCFRLIDVMKQISKSIAGLEINAPRYDVGGQFYDNVLLNGNLLRNIQNKPFYVSWEDIIKSIKPEHNADDEITVDNRVFVGIEQDFYTSEECGFFDTTQFSSMIKKPNPIFCLNKFTFKYSKYQSLKEAEQLNSADTIHGESRLTPYNQKVENQKECAVEWVRDTILLEEQRQKALVVSKDTTTQDDDSIFAVDTIVTENDQQFTESTTLQHTFYDPYLSLRSNGEVNFVVLGIKENTVFKIEYPDLNFGNYIVYTVSDTELKLTRTSLPSIGSGNDGLRVTKYVYEIKKESIPLTNRTNQEFTAIVNLTNPERYSNLRYSVERNIRNYWNSFLATVNLYWKEKPIINTYYKNNGDCETNYNGLLVKEKEDFIPTNPILSPFMYEKIIFANVDFSDFILLQNMVRTKRGFIRTIDNNDRVLKVYPMTLSYENLSRQLTLSGQEKFEKAYLTISTGNNVITINNETKLKKLTYTVDEGNKIALYDLERQRLYNSCVWNKISVNNATAPTLEVLKSWLDLLSI